MIGETVAIGVALPVGRGSNRGPLADNRVADDL
jgi:hypothetical protein